jgi:cellobiose-specific phosphotransferase system component IIA
VKQELIEAIQANAKKAAKTEKSDDALKFSQAALNAAHALATVVLNIDK